MLRFLFNMIIIATVTILVCLIFFPIVNFDLDMHSLRGNAAELEKIFQLFLSIIPSNVTEPFVNGNILQIIFVAVLTGFCTVFLGHRVANVKKIIFELREVVFKIVKVILRVMNLIIFLCIFKSILINSFEEILSVWKMVAAQYSAFVILSVLMLFQVSIKYRINILDFLKKLYPAYLIAFTTCSGSASMPKNIEVCEKNLNIDKNIVEFYIPMSHALFPATMITGIIIYTFYAAEFSGVQLSMAQLLVIAFLGIQFAVSAVKANGGMVATIGLLLMQLGLSLESIGAMMIADVFLVNMAGVVNLIIRDCDLIDFSHNIKLHLTQNKLA